MPATSPTVTDPPQREAAPQPLSREPGADTPSSSGAGRVLCGNPTKGLRERRHQSQVHPAPTSGPGLQHSGSGPASWLSGGEWPSVLAWQYPALKPFQGPPALLHPPQLTQSFCPQATAHLAPSKAMPPASPFPPQAWAPPEQLPPRRPEDLAASASTPEPDPLDDHDLLSWAGLRAWRELSLRWVPLPHQALLPCVSPIWWGLTAGGCLGQAVTGSRMVRGAGHGSLGLGVIPESYSFGIGSGGGAGKGQGCSLSLSPHPNPLPCRCLESQQEGATTPQCPRRGPEEQKDQAGPKTSPSPLSPTPGTESDPTHHPTMGSHLGPAPSSARL